MIFRTIFLTTALVSFFSACDKPENLGGCPFPTDLEQGYEMIWSDEFDGTMRST